VIPDTELLDIGADSSHDPRDLVAQHGWHRNDIVCGEQQVGVTQPRGSHVDEDLAPDRCSNVHVLEFKPATEFVNYKCLHVCFLAEFRQSGTLVISATNEL
jgi:hypothetical protein